MCISDKLGGPHRILLVVLHIGQISVDEPRLQPLPLQVKQPVVVFGRYARFLLPFATLGIEVLVVYRLR
jgi:hypothetical protein